MLVVSSVYTSLYCSLPVIRHTLYIYIYIYIYVCAHAKAKILLPNGPMHKSNQFYFSITSAITVLYLEFIFRIE